MKKLLTLALALALALSLSATAFAEGDEDTGTTNRDTTITQNTDPKTGSTQVNYNVAPAYSVTIPSSVTIGDTNDSTNTVTVSAAGVKIANGNKVVVKLTGINVTEGNADGDSTFTVALTDNTSEKLAYTVTASGNVESSASGSTPASNKSITSTNNTVLTVEAGLNNESTGESNDKELTGASTGSTTLTFALAENEVVKYAGEYKGTVTFTVSVEKPTTTP